MLAAVLTSLACSGEGSPQDAPEAKFCEAFNLLAEADSGADFQEFAERLRDVGTPADITNDGRAGYEVVIRVASSLEADATLEDLQDPSVSKREVQQATEFLEYGGETCSRVEESGA